MYFISFIIYLASFYYHFSFSFSVYSYTIFSYHHIPLFASVSPYRFIPCTFSSLSVIHTLTCLRVWAVSRLQSWRCDVGGDLAASSPRPRVRTRRPRVRTHPDGPLRPAALRLGGRNRHLRTDKGVGWIQAYTHSAEGICNAKAEIVSYVSADWLILLSWFIRLHIHTTVPSSPAIFILFLFLFLFLFFLLYFTISSSIYRVNILLPFLRLLS